MRRAHSPQSTVHSLFLLLLFIPRAVFAADNLHESWDIAYLADSKIGYVHTLVDRREAGGQLVIHTRHVSQLTVKRFSDTMRMAIAEDSFELADGRLYAVDSHVKMANHVQQTRGRLEEEGKFKVTTVTPGSQQTDTIDNFPDDVLGPFAHERLLREKPLAPGETRNFRSFIPQLGKPANNVLTAIRKEGTKLRDGSSRELLLIEHTNDLIPLKTSLWVDEEGSVLKSQIPLAGVFMTTYRGTKAEALDTPAGETVDLGYQTLVKIAQPIPNAHQSKAIVYRLELGDKPAADSIPESAYQKIERRAGNTVWVRVSRTAPPENAAAGKPDAEFLEPNGFIQSDNATIAQSAREIAGAANGAWEKAKRLERWVDQNMVNRDFNIGFATAGEVIETRQGDCTEHAVLLAALCRANGIPARVAMGLVYIEGAQAFGYHMWTEVNVADTWHPLDGTLGQGFIAGGHIKLADGSLKGASAMSTFLPILAVIGKLTIHVEAVE